MSEHKSHKVLIANIPKGKPICRVGNKSYLGLVFGLIFIVGMFFYFRNILLVLPMIIYELFLSLKPYKGIFDGYNSFFVIYDKDNKKEADLYYLSELKYWCSDGTFFNPSVIFFLNDGEKVVLKKAIDSEIFDYLRKVAEKKEIQKKK